MMRLFAISDLHLSGGDDKPMDVFGDHWENHFGKIAGYWQENITDQDAVLIAGDISWAMQLENALDDLHMIGDLPGHKVLLRGNHDYWWSSVTRVRDCLPKNMYVIQNDAVRIGDHVFCGSRGWGTEETKEDARIFARELLRLEMSLKQAERLGGDITVLCHYPPVTEKGELTPAGRIICSYPVKHVVYGHLHGIQTPVFNGEVNGVPFFCTSCDKIGFCPVRIDGGDESIACGDY